MKIDYEQKKIVWDREDFVAGWAPVAQTATAEGNAGRTNANGATDMSNIDPFGQYPGWLYPGPGPTALTGVSGTSLTTILVDATLDLNSANAYAMGGALIHKFDVTTDALSTVSPFPKTIAQASATGALGQIVFHRTQGTAQVVFYSFNYGTAGNVGTYDIVADSFNDNFLSQVPTSGAVLGTASHPMMITADDLLLIGNGNKVNLYKQSNNTYSTNVLNFPDVMEVVGFAEPEDGFDTVVFCTTARGSQRRGRAIAYWWSIDRPASWYKQSKIPDDECAAPFAYKGTVGCFTRSRSAGGRSVMRLYEDGQWKPKYYFTGTLPGVGGVDVQNDMVVFNSDGELHRWGNYGDIWPYAGFHYSTGGGTTTGGFVKNFSNSGAAKFYSSSGTGTSGGLESYSNFHTTATWNGCHARPDLPLRKKMKIAAVNLHLSAQTGDLSMNISGDKFTTPIQPFNSYTGSTSDVVRIWMPEDFLTRDDTATATIEPQFTWAGTSSAIGIERCEIYYELVDFVKN